MRLFFFLLLFSVPAYGQKSKVQWKDSLNPEVFSLTMLMMHDVVNPAAASRYYAYCMMPAYEIISRHDPSVIPLDRFIKSYHRPAPIPAGSSYDYEIAALYSILEAGKQFLPSGRLLQSQQDKLIARFKKMKIPAAVIRESVLVAEEAVMHMLIYSKGDNYNKLSTMRRYTPDKTDSTWYPTPPGYMEAVEPHWKTIRPLIIDSASQCMPKRQVAFSKDSNSAFFKLAKEVYDASPQNNTEHTLIAGYWDCNPFAIATSGHMMLGFKKINPGGHWMNIAGIATRTGGLDFNKTVVTQTLTAITLMDAFISCWDEKYRSNRIRPETYINRYIDARWQPLLQTPPFPEYTSGHSVISTAAAEMLTYLLGDHFIFTDNTEVMFELPERKFTSFRKAAAEAAISRLYGGIHYRDSVEHGQEQGKAIAGRFINILREAGLQPFP